MPIYEYECSACGHQLEAFQKISEDALVECPNCNKPKLKKLISAAGFKLTGTGWYETDFKDSGKKKQEAKSTQKSESNNTSKSSTKTETKQTKTDK